jgi:microsomal dipeptidase-like Zn-dependent dipeptidase
LLYFSAHFAELIGTSSVTLGLDFFGGGPEYFKISPFTWQDNELIPVLMAKPAELGNSREEKS